MRKCVSRSEKTLPGMISTLFSMALATKSLADAPSGVALRAQIVNATGGTVWNGRLETQTHKIALAKKLAPGNYFVRLFDENGKLLHEYGFQVRDSL